MPRLAVLALAFVLFPLAAGCGGSSADAVEEPAVGSLVALRRAPGEDVAIVQGTADPAPGRVRLSFLVVNGQGQVATRPTARV